MTDDDGPAFRDADLLHDAFAREVDRPGLEGPGFEAVLRSGRRRVRRRRATVSATVAAAAVAVGTTAAVSRWPGPSRDVAGASGVAAPQSGGAPSSSAAAAGAASSSPPASGAAGTAVGTPGGVPGSGTPLSDSAGAPGAATYQFPADVPLNAGMVDGHAWRLALTFDPSQPQMCSQMSLFVDGAMTNAGGGGEDCLVDGKLTHLEPAVAHPGFSSIEIIGPGHVDLGGVVAGTVDPSIVSVVAECAGGGTVKGAPFEAVDGWEYYSLAFPAGSNCAEGDLAFYDASQARVASISGAALGTTK